MIETFAEYFEGLSKFSGICAAFCPTRKNEAMEESNESNGKAMGVGGGLVSLETEESTHILF